MACETVSKEIDGVEYKITQLGAKMGRKVLAHLVRIVGRVGGAEGEIDLGAALDALTDAEVDFLCDTFAGTTRIVLPGDRELDMKSQFDSHFVGKYGAMVKWLWASLEVNFADFLGDANLQTLLAGVSLPTSAMKTAPRSSTSLTPAMGA